MTRDDVIRMANEAGIVTGENLRFSEGLRYRSVGNPTNVREQALIDFAALVAAHEREQCAKAVEPSNMDTPADWTEYAKAKAEAAAAIRARGTPKGGA